MLPRVVHFPVNWQDGMKISRDHFIQSDNAYGEQIRDVAGMHLTNYNFGLLQGDQSTKASLQIEITSDAAEQTVVRIITCRGVTPGGARIEITSDREVIQSTIATSSLKVQAYEIYLVVDPFRRVAVGQPDANETPLRQPFSMPTYRVDILPYPQTFQPEWSAFHLCVGRLRSESDLGKIDEHYIPPCTAVSSHARLVAIHQRFFNQLSETEVAISGVLQWIRTKREMASLDYSMSFLMEKMANYLAGSMDRFRLLYPQLPAVEMISYFCSFARVINSALNVLLRKDREELLEYFHKWFELPPRDMENMLRTLITLTYDHQDCYVSLQKVEKFIDRVVTMLKKLNELNYGTKASSEKIYGWIVLHTEGRKRSIYKIAGKNVVIGRKEAGGPDVDIDIADDAWVSRKHARLIAQEEGGEMVFQLVDLNSNNGTYIHDTQTRLKPNQEFSLIDGDTFQVGRTNLVVRSFDRVGGEKELKEEMDRIATKEVVNIKDLVMG
ncbi:FHA domain-containing protein [Chryseolinea sp. T2]|uniref:FHA domain-containing protein n=1 Tax=Chryseolinea sp. T2 TaxID=3129255 RepID=UPI00307739CC